MLPPRSHLCILRPPYLGLILRHRKTIECRLSRIPCPPFEAVRAGDVLYLKQSGGPIRGRAVAAQVAYFHPVTATVLAWLRRTYNRRICAAPTFWRNRSCDGYGTLIWLEEVSPICPPRRFNKTDRRGWVVLKTGWEARR